MTRTTSAYIHGLGLHVPEKVYTNADLERMVDTNDEWITTRTGIRQRHIAAPGQTTSELGAAAARAALADAGLEPDDLTHILTATLSPDCYTPSTSCLIEDKLGVKGVMAMDVNAACSGFCYNLEVARSLVNLHPGACVLTCAAEVLSSRTNWQDRTTCVLFGDGAGAAVITGRPGHRAGEIVDVALGSDGALAELLTIKGGGSAAPYALGDVVGEDFFIQMQGREVFRHAVRAMSQVALDVLARNGLAARDVDLLVPHQANVRIMDAVAKKLDIPRQKIFVNVDRYGNTSAASVPIALAEARAAGRLTPGTRVLVVTFGGGFTWGAALIQF
jgi:3-oxoacyl-[acyl-carrier-protein] synthase-3